MNTKGCAFLLGILLIAVLAYTLITSNPGSEIPIPTFSIPTFGSIGTLPPILSSTLALTPGSPNQTHTPTRQPTAQPTVKPTQGPPENGRILFLGFDKAVWSTNPDGTGAVQLGYISDIQLNNFSKWFSPNGQYVLVTRLENNQNVAFLTSTDGSHALQIAPLQPAFDFGAPRDIYAFSSDSSKFFFIDASSDPASALVVDLATWNMISWPVQASAEELSYAAFTNFSLENAYNVSPHLIIKAFDPAINGHYLELFDLTTNLTNPRRIAELKDHRIEQFTVSPNGRFVAISYRNAQDLDASDEIYALDIQSGKQIPLASVPNESQKTRALFIYPSWSTNNRFLVVNVWTYSQPLRYDLVSYDLQTGSMKFVINNLPSETFGQPLAHVGSYSPDGSVAGVYLLAANSLSNLEFYRAQLDGSQTLKIASAETKNDFTSGEYVAAVVNDWTHMLLVSSNSAGGLPDTGSLFSTWLDGNGRVKLDDLIPLPYFNLAPVTSPDGKYVAFLHINLTKQVAEFTIIGLDGQNRIILFTGSVPSAGKVPVGLPIIWLPKPK